MRGEAQTLGELSSLDFPVRMQFTEEDIQTLWNADKVTGLQTGLGIERVCII